MALSQGALCVLLAGRMKDEGLWSWRSAPEMPTEPARRCHTNQHMLYTYLGGMNLLNFSAWHFILHLFSLIGSSMNNDRRAPGGLS